MTTDPRLGWVPPGGTDIELQEAGRSWDAVKVPRQEGLRALTMLGDHSGAVIDDGHWLYWLITPDSAGWRLPGVSVLGAASFLAVPPRRRTGPLGPYWRVPRAARCHLTPAGLLHEALRRTAGPW